MASSSAASCALTTTEKEWCERVCSPNGFISSAECWELVCGLGCGGLSDASLRAAVAAGTGRACDDGGGGGGSTDTPHAVSAAQLRSVVAALKRLTSDSSFSAADEAARLAFAALEAPPNAAQSPHERRRVAHDAAPAAAAAVPDGADDGGEAQASPPRPPGPLRRVDPGRLRDILDEFQLQAPLDVFLTSQEQAEEEAAEEAALVAAGCLPLLPPPSDAGGGGGDEESQQSAGDGVDWNLSDFNWADGSNESFDNKELGVGYARFCHLIRDGGEGGDAEGLLGDPSIASSLHRSGVGDAGDGGAMDAAAASVLRASGRGSGGDGDGGADGSGSGNLAELFKEGGVVGGGGGGGGLLNRVRFVKMLQRGSTGAGAAVPAVAAAVADSSTSRDKLDRVMSRRPEARVAGGGGGGGGGTGGVRGTRAFVSPRSSMSSRMSSQRHSAAPRPRSARRRSSIAQVVNPLPHYNAMSEDEMRAHGILTPLGSATFSRRLSTVPAAAGGGGETEYTAEHELLGLLEGSNPGGGGGGGAGQRGQRPKPRMSTREHLRHLSQAHRHSTRGGVVGLESPPGSDCGGTLMSGKEEEGQHSQQQQHQQPQQQPEFHREKRTSTSDSESLHGRSGGQGGLRRRYTHRDWLSLGRGAIVRELERFINTTTTTDVVSGKLGIDDPRLCRVLGTFPFLDGTASLSATGTVYKAHRRNTKAYYL